MPNLKQCFLTAKGLATVHKRAKVNQHVRGVGVPPLASMTLIYAFIWFLKAPLGHYVRKANTLFLFLTLKEEKNSKKETTKKVDAAMTILVLTPKKINK